MPWVRLDDQFPEHAKVDRSGHLAGWLYVVALCHSNRVLTDGFISDAVMPRLTTVPAPKKQAAKLIAAGLWDRVDGGYLIHDYLKYQKSAAAIRKERAVTAARQQRFRNTRRNAVSNGSGNGHVTASPLPHPKGSVVENSSPPRLTQTVTESDPPQMSKAERSRILATAKAKLRADGGVNDLGQNP